MTKNMEREFNKRIIAESYKGSGVKLDSDDIEYGAVWTERYLCFGMNYHFTDVVLFGNTADTRKQLTVKVR